jgi:hypothetical protein
MIQTYMKVFSTYRVEKGIQWNKIKIEAKNIREWRAPCELLDTQNLSLCHLASTPLPIYTTSQFSLCHFLFKALWLAAHSLQTTAAIWR